MWFVWLRLSRGTKNNFSGETHCLVLPVSVQIHSFDWQCSGKLIHTKNNFRKSPNISLLPLPASVLLLTHTALVLKQTLMWIDSLKYWHEEFADCFFPIFSTVKSATVTVNALFRCAGMLCKAFGWGLMCFMRFQWLTFSMIIMGLSYRSFSLIAHLKVFICCSRPCSVYL